MMMPHDLGHRRIAFVQGQKCFLRDFGVFPDHFHFLGRTFGRTAHPTAYHTNLAVHETDIVCLRGEIQGAGIGFTQPHRIGNGST